MRTIYGINGNDDVVFLDLIAAEKYLYNNYPEYMGSKDQVINFCETMIWEEDIK